MLSTVHDGHAVGEELEVVIEVPRLGFIKRTAAGAIDFVSPLPCPVNYGSVVGSLAPDDDPVDAVVLGPRLSRGARVRVVHRATIGFLDAGLDDRKLICSRAPLGAADRALLLSFFRVYALAKAALNRARGRPGATRFLGFIHK